MQLVERRGRLPQIGSGSRVELATVVESIPDPTFLFNAQGKLVQLNRLAEDLCGRTRKELENITIAELNTLLAARDEFDHPIPKPSMGVNRALHGEVVRNLRRVFRHPIDHRVMETVTSASPIRGESGEIPGALLIVHDVTEVSQLQRRLADTQRHKEVGEMAAGLAHDFSNVLDTIVQAVTLMDIRENRPAPERRTYTEMVRKAVGQGAEIIDRVREYLRTGTGERTEVDVRQVLQDALELTRPLWYSRPEIRVKSDLPEIPPVIANAADLRRVFTNLIINALEAMPGGGCLTVETHSAGNVICVIVSDTGQGIAPEQQKQIFLPYFTTKSQGTGLGLSGAQRIINGLHGRIRFQSEAGKGTTFVIELPKKLDNSGHDKSPLENPRQDAGREQRPQDHRGNDRTAIPRQLEPGVPS